MTKNTVKSKSHPLMVYVGEYFEQAVHLSTEQHGAYFLLLMYLHTAGTVPVTDDVKLAGITNLSVRKWKRMRTTILELIEEQALAKIGEAR